MSIQMTAFSLEWGEGAMETEVGMEISLRCSWGRMFLLPCRFGSLLELFNSEGNYSVVFLDVLGKTRVCFKTSLLFFQRT